MKLAGLLALGLLCLPRMSHAQDPEPPVLDRNSAWFQPSLKLNEAPVCADLLRVEQESFFSPTVAPNHEHDGFKKLRERYLEPIVADPQVLPIGESYEQQLRLTLPDRQTAFVYFLKYPGCGGGCESEQVLVSGRPFDPAPSYRYEGPHTPNAPAWPMYKGSDGEFYVVGRLEQRLAAYKITPAEAVLACEVQLQPTGMSEHQDASIRSAARAVEELMQAAGQMYQGAGDCGSGKFHWLRWQSGSDALNRMLYQPWAVTESQETGAYDSVERNLQKWSLTGVEDYKKYARYRQKLERTEVELARFYHESFGWPATQAQATAHSAMRHVIGRLFAFGGYDPSPEEAKLRQAILERQPLVAIKALSLESVDEFESDAWPSTRESILSVAIEYPQALQYLLEQDFDPNSANAFGKTPLMYAAQHDQLEAARLLLAAGADPNAATHLPGDTCYYQIFRSGLTPLHYAARYASASLISLLVEHGAATFTKANLDRYSESQHYPLQWLEEYAGDPQPTRSPAVGADRNTRIAAHELPELLELLRVPSDAERQRISAEALLKSQEACARGEFQVAYRHLQLALAAQPNDEDKPEVAVNDKTCARRRH